MKVKMMKLLAELLSGLQAPMSVGVPLGTALEPLNQIRSELHLFGWPTVEEHEQALIKYLIEE